MSTASTIEFFAMPKCALRKCANIVHYTRDSKHPGEIILSKHCYIRKCSPLDNSCGGRVRPLNPDPGAADTCLELERNENGDTSFCPQKNTGEYFCKERKRRQIL